MFHLAAFVQSIDPANAFTAITAVREEMFFTNGVDYRIPATFNKIAGYGACGNDASVSRAQIASPSLRLQANLDIEPVLQTANFAAGLQALTLFPENPVELVEDEAMNVFFLSDPAAPQIHAALVLLADGPLAPVSGKVFTVRCTATIAQTAATWVNGNLTFGQVLPAGQYAVVGGRFRSTDAIAMRLVFPAQVARPGYAAATTIGTLDRWDVRTGSLGVWGEFPNTIPPTLDVLGGAAAAQTVLLDLIRIG